MIELSIPDNITGAREYAIWLVTIMIVAFGFRYVREIIDLVLEKMYEIFIEKNPIT